MTDSISWQGMDSLVGTLHQLSPRVTTFLTTAMFEEAVLIFNQSQIQVPVRYGILKASGHIDPPEVGEDGVVSVYIGYGGAAAGYALFVHENMSARHRPPTKAKYLEDPMTEALAHLTSRLQDRMEGVIMGQYPQAPANAVSSELQTTIGREFKSRASLASHITRAKPLSPSEVRGILNKLSRGRR